ncbi:MAG: hypothetical protein FWE92_05140 [Defluviitaleaceae bacterium]|nr:hypothetical protein [Defluviitaleaceae bacterium]
MSNIKHLSLRIDEATLRKLHYVAKYYDRSASKQILRLINKTIREFEEEHGKIDLSGTES